MLDMCDLHDFCYRDAPSRTYTMIFGDLDAHTRRERSVGELARVLGMSLMPLTNAESTAIGERARQIPSRQKELWALVPRD